MNSRAKAGKPVRFSDFRGSAVAFTFFFTSCPLPEYCPRMNRNFSEARKLLAGDPSAPTNWELLSISFDSSFDTPQILAQLRKFLSRRRHQPLAVCRRVHQHAGQPRAEGGFEFLAHERFHLAQPAHGGHGWRWENHASIRRQRLDAATTGRRHPRRRQNKELNRVVGRASSLSS